MQLNEITTQTVEKQSARVDTTAGGRAGSAAVDCLKYPPLPNSVTLPSVQFPSSNNVVTVICHKLRIWVQLTRGLENVFEVKNIRLCWLQGMRHDPLFIDFGCKSALGRHIVYGSSVAAYNDDVHRK